MINMMSMLLLRKVFAWAAIVAVHNLLLLHLFLPHLDRASPFLGL